jgi:V/A-type H+-transporting ATPase subunit E
MEENTEVSSGVRELITRLRDDGVKAGREKAAQVLQEAQEEAARIVADAEAEADGILSRAKVQIERDQEACMGSLRMAIRDTELKMEAELVDDEYMWRWQTQISGTDGVKADFQQATGR